MKLNLFIWLSCYLNCNDVLMELILNLNQFYKYIFTSHINSSQKIDDCIVKIMITTQLK